MTLELDMHRGLGAGSIAVSAGPYAFEVSVATAVCRLLATHRRVKVHATVADPLAVVRDVVAGRIDAGIADPDTGDFVRGRTPWPLVQAFIELLRAREYEIAAADKRVAMAARNGTRPRRGKPLKIAGSRRNRR